MVVPRLQLGPQPLPTSDVAGGGPWAWPPASSPHLPCSAQTGGCWRVITFQVVNCHVANTLLALGSQCFPGGLERQFRVIPMWPGPGTSCPRIFLQGPGVALGPCRLWLRGGQPHSGERGQGCSQDGWYFCHGWERQHLCRVTVSRTSPPWASVVPAERGGGRRDPVLVGLS